MHDSFLTIGFFHSAAMIKSKSVLQGKTFCPNLYIRNM